MLVHQTPIMNPLGSLTTSSSPLEPTPPELSSGASFLLPAAPPSTAPHSVPPHAALENTHRLPDLPRGRLQVHRGEARLLPLRAPPQGLQGLRPGAEMAGFQHARLAPVEPPPQEAERNAGLGLPKLDGRRRRSVLATPCAILIGPGGSQQEEEE
ncbi:hypothetical protein VTK73DRAFT_2795 [Phialemonium thermophilum]|uniref:Uncharacterized protein n=1 Tax=Phialemonium thermophilum TaxID=223376 RepID=A0ABR3VRE1_9PEZI